MRLIVALLALSVAANAAAAVYKWVQPDGSVVYSDRAPEGITAPAELPELQEIKMPPPPAPSTENTSNDQSVQTPAVDYTKLQITEPADNSSFHDTAGQVTIKLDLQPALQEGDVVSIVMDGKEVGQGKSSAVSLSNVDRGSHTLRAMVKNTNGKPAHNNR